MVDKKRFEQKIDQKWLDLAEIPITHDISWLNPNEITDFALEQRPFPITLCLLAEGQGGMPHRSRI